MQLWFIMSQMNTLFEWIITIGGKYDYHNTHNKLYIYIYIYIYDKTYLILLHSIYCCLHHEYNQNNYTHF